MFDRVVNTPQYAFDLTTHKPFLNNFSEQNFTSNFTNAAISSSRSKVRNSYIFILVMLEILFLHFLIIYSSQLQNFILTLSRRRPLSYRNQSIDLLMITASILKGLTGIVKNSNFVFSKT